MNDQTSIPSDDKFPVKATNFTRNLKVELSKDDIVERAKRAAYLAREIALKEEERDTAKKHANAKIEELEAEAKRLQSEISDGATFREVQCQTRYIYRTAEVQEVRLDTNEVLSSRPMTDRERQPELPLGEQPTPEKPDEVDIGWAKKQPITWPPTEDTVEALRRVRVACGDWNITWPPTEDTVEALSKIALGPERGWALNRIEEMPDGARMCVFKREHQTRNIDLWEGMLVGEAVEALHGLFDDPGPIEKALGGKHEAAEAPGLETEKKGKGRGKGRK